MLLNHGAKMYSTTFKNSTVCSHFGFFLFNISKFDDSFAPIDKVAFLLRPLKSGVILCYHLPTCLDIIYLCCSLDGVLIMLTGAGLTILQESKYAIEYVTVFKSLFLTEVNTYDISVKPF